MFQNILQWKKSLIELSNTQTVFLYFYERLGANQNFIFNDY